MIESVRPVRSAADHQDALQSQAGAGPTVVALVFAHRDSDVMRMLDVRGAYFDRRSGDTWDLFFPGYYRASGDSALEQASGATRFAVGYMGDWFFSADDFDSFREHVERSSGGRWKYSGGADLVLVNAWLPADADPVIDWTSTIAGQLSDQPAGVQTLTLAEVVERITRDLASAEEDAFYGVGEITEADDVPSDHLVRGVVMSALGGIAAAFAKRGLGI
jgi:hypothetical protein